MLNGGPASALAGGCSAVMLSNEVDCGDFVLCAYGNIKTKPKVNK